MFNQALVRPAYMQEAKEEQARLKEEKEFFQFLHSNQGREARLQGSEAVSLKKVISFSKVTQVPYITTECPYRKNSLLEKAWYYGAQDRKLDLEAYIYHVENQEEIYLC